MYDSPTTDYVKSSTAADILKMGIPENTEKRMARAGATLMVFTFDIHGSFLVVVLGLIEEPRPL